MKNQSNKWPDFRFNLEEIAGAVGDYGTLIPIVIGVVIVSNIISGLILLPIALFFASPEFVAIIPLGVFGALLVFVAIELVKHGLETDSYVVTGIIAILSLILGFLPQDIEQLRKMPRPSMAVPQFKISTKRSSYRAL